MATTQEVPAYQEDQRDAGLVAQTEKLGLHEQELEHDHANGLSNGLAIDNDHGIVRDVNGLPLTEHEDAVDSNKPTDLGHPYSENELREEYEHENGTIGETASIRTSNTRPTMKEPSRSYARSIPIVTTYEPELEDNNVNKRQSVAGSVRSVSRAPSVMAAGVIPAPVQAAPSVRAPSVKAPSVKRAASTKAESYREPVSPVIAQKAPSVRSPSRAGSVKANSIRRQSQQPNGDVQPGSVISPERQREMQNRVSLVDNGARRNDDYNQQQQRSVSPRPTSPFGHRPQPNLMSVIEDGRESRYDGNDRSGVLGRSGTVLSRANTQGRNGTLSRAANGGTVGSRRGAFGRGAGASIGTQPEEVLGRDDIHTRAELSERILDDATLRRLSTMEKKDAARLAKIIKSEGKAEHAAVKGSIKELERLNKLQREAAHAERKSQSRLSKWISKEHRARLRFLKEKERYEKVEGDLRNAENDYEERRDHAAGLTAQVAEKTQELDDLRGQKAADDREREVKLLALKNPAHS